MKLKTADFIRNFISPSDPGTCTYFLNVNKPLRGQNYEWYGLQMGPLKYLAVFRMNLLYPLILLVLITMKIRK